MQGTWKQVTQSENWFDLFGHVQWKLLSGKDTVIRLLAGQEIGMNPLRNFLTKTMSGLRLSLVEDMLQYEV